MQSLRSSKFIAKLVLVWFALFLGSAIASTVIQSDHLQMVCATGGVMKMVDSSSDDGELKASASMDCPLCAPLIPPPAPEARVLEPVNPLGHVLRTLPSAHIAGLTGAPLPPRGPPALN